jgi:hypothetical protein
LEVALEDRSVTLAPEETRELMLQVTAGAALVPIAVQAAQAFRPADGDRVSGDMRWLGSQVRVEVR